MTRLCTPRFVAAMAAGALWAGVSFAGDTSAAGGQDWFRGETVRPTEVAMADAPPATGRDFNPPPPPAAPPRRMGPGGAQAQSDFPDDQVHDWVMANARCANSRATFHRAERELDETIRTTQWTFEQSKEYLEAQAAEKEAYNAYTAERQKALQSVIDDPQYQAALQLRDEMGTRIAHLRASKGGLPHDMLLAMASQKLQFATDAHNLESAALDKDDALKDARQKLVQANGKVSELRAHFDLSVRTNPQILQARRNLEDARVALITAEAYLNATSAATAVATDYSYYRHRWDGLSSSAWPNWGPYGY